MKKKFSITLPTELNNKILAIGLQPAQLAKAYRFVYAFRRISQNNKCGLSVYMPLPAILITKIIGSGYRSLLNKLIIGQVLEVHSWWNGKRLVESYDVGRCRKYRINPENINDNIISVTYWDARDFETARHIRINGRKCNVAVVTDDLNSLIVDSIKLLAATNQALSKIDYSNFQIDNEIKDSRFCVQNHYTGFENWYSHEKCMEYIKRRGWTLIKDGRSFYIDDFDRYIAMKRRNILWSYKSTINRLVRRAYNVNRNSTNKRLDHNLTSMPKTLMEILIHDNNLVEIDLKNSQFAILAHLMGKDKTFKRTKDFENFCEVTAGGTLYEYIQKEFGISERSEAKTMMMELAFSSHRHTSIHKKELKRLFPSVVSFIDTYKKRAVKKYGQDAHKRFAIWLQKTEAKIFIDSLYFKLKIKQNLFVLTKHDSLIVKKQDELHVRNLIQQYFTSIDFLCKIN